MNYLPDLRNLKIGRRREYEIIDILGSPGAYGVTYKAIDKKLNAPVAIKFLKPENLDNYWKEEAQKASQLRNVPQIVQIYDFDEDEIEKDGKRFTLHYLVWEFLEGEPLKNYFIKKDSFSSEFIIEIVRQLCYAVKAMQVIGLEHGDLHTGNILIIPPKDYEPNYNYKLKIIDFGLAKSYIGNTFRNDMEYVTDILKDFWKKNSISSDDFKIEDKKFQTLIPNLIKQLEDTTLERKLIDPIDTIKKLDDILNTVKINLNKEKADLKNPFEYLSAEEMPEYSDLLYYLYSSNLPWFKNIESFGNIIISGPRGCGKSMILKNMRWQTKLMSTEYQKKHFFEDNYLGFYIHCHHSIYLPFAGIYINYNDPEIQDKFIHYILLLITYEIISTLNIVEEFNLLNFSTDFKQELVNILEQNIFSNNILFLQDVNIFSYLSTLLEKETTYVQKCIIDNIKLNKVAKINFLNELCNFLYKKIDYFKNKKIFFLLDDYSHPKVRQEIQKAFNRILGVRNSLYCFKISSEKFSFTPWDFDLEKANKTFQQDREYTYLDLGGKYLSYKKDIELQNFISTIINKRISRSKDVSDLTTDSLFGKYETESGGIAYSLIKDKKTKKRNTLYSGINIIYSLCGGDIATILQLCKEIYDSAYIKTNNEVYSGHIPFKIQDKIIREFSKKRLDRIKEIFNFGTKCYELIEVFGKISRAYLYDYGKITKDKNRFYEVIRIEITDSGKLPSDAFEIYKTLLLEGIFTDEGGRYPWGNGILNNALVLRPIFTPTLQISYRRRECLRISTSKFIKFLIEPNEFSKTATKFLRENLGFNLENKANENEPTLFPNVT